MKFKARSAKIGEEFIKELREIKALRRIDVDKDLPREISDARITDGLVKFPEWKLLKDKLVKEPRIENMGRFK